MVPPRFWPTLDGFIPETPARAGIGAFQKAKMLQKGEFV